ncbi:MAG TPA: hypothetical protein VHC63_13675 [Acidimicrobiales bacterium]|nr:hypothetical protein [Acidimicrobiales bacterium]
MADDDKTPIERLLETAFYAPLGIAAMVREELPKLVARGHQEATMAKTMGQFAVTMGRAELEKRLKQIAERPASNRPASSPVATAATPAAPATQTPPPAPASPPPAPPAPAAATAESNGTPVTVHDAQSLAIPGYDSLSASQVVERLAGLNAEELEAIGSYEAAGRGRRTILNRVAQLRG